MSEVLSGSRTVMPLKSVAVAQRRPRAVDTRWAWVHSSKTLFTKTGSSWSGPASSRCRTPNLAQISRENSQRAPFLSLCCP